jgi:hypothetical protein
MALATADPLLLRYPATSSKHSYFFCCLHYNVFTESLPSNDLAVHVTLLLLISPECKCNFATLFLKAEIIKKKKNSVVLVRKQTILIERSPLVSEASAYFSG